MAFGVLSKENRVDISTNALLLSHCQHMKATFHMAFDELENLHEGLETIIELGFRRILTKGGKFGSALEGADSLR